MRKDKIVYSLSIEDIQEIADQDLERELTKEELKKVIELVPDYVNWSEAISYTFDALGLQPQEDEE